MKIAFHFVFFLLGFVLCGLFFLPLSSSEIEFPLGFEDRYSSESPSDYLGEEEIIVFDNMVVIMVNDASISRYADSGSMEPVLDSNSNGIRISPENESEIHVGDIVTYRDGLSLVVHRVIERGEDAEGIYFITAGDNNDFADSKIRFSDIRYKTIGILY
jgi:hypothetical protein